MAKHETRDELIKHKEVALKKLEDYMDALINDKDSNNWKADKLSYWLEDWVRFLNDEPNFKSSTLKRYKRGEIIKAHLGYNVGSEEGGLHYCVVLEKNNSIHNPVVTVAPLTSIKENFDIKRMHKANVYLGDELYTMLNSKLTQKESSLRSDIQIIMDSIASKDVAILDAEAEIFKCNSKLEQVEKILREINKMKHGSIALMGQVRVLSKIRIYDPKSTYDVLNNIRLSNNYLDIIDDKMKELYISK